MLRTIPEPNHNHKVEPMRNNEFDMFGFDASAASNALNMNKSNNVNHFDNSLGLGQNEQLPYGVAKRVEELGSGSSGGESPIEHSPFTSPPMMSNSMDYPGLSEYTGYCDPSSTMGQSQTISAQSMSASMSMNSQQTLSPGMPPSNIANIPQTPIRQNSAYAGGNLPRNMEFHHYVKDENLGIGVDNGMDLPFR